MPGCSAPGCRIKGVRVQVTVFDLIALMDETALPLHDIFERAVQAGITESDFGWPYRAFHMVVKKPCPFLKDHLCEVHEAKPLACRVFPEAFILRGKLEELRRHPEFRFFPCFITPPKLDDDGIAAVRRFDAMWRSERAVSNHFVFGAPVALVDSRRLPDEAEEQERLFSSPDLLMMFRERVAPIEDRKVREGVVARVLDRVFVARIHREGKVPERVFEVNAEGFYQMRRRPTLKSYAKYI